MKSKLSILLLLLTLVIPSPANAQFITTLGAGVPNNSITATASSAGLHGTVYATPSNSTYITWTTSFSSTPASITVVLEGSLDNSTFYTIDTSTNTAGEMRSVNTSTRFVRVSVNASSGTFNVTASLIIKSSPVISGILSNPTILFGDGTVGNPSISLSTEPGLGFYKLGTGYLALANDNGFTQTFGPTSYNMGVGGVISWNSTVHGGAGVGDTTLGRGGAAGKVVITGGTNTTLQLGGTTSSFSAIRSNGNILEAVKADGSSYTSFAANAQLTSTDTMLWVTTPPTTPVFGTTPSIVNNNGSAVFTVNVGTGGVASTGSVAMPTATTGWACNVTDRNTNIVTRETSTTTTSVTVTAASAWAASDILQFICFAY